MTQLEAAFLTSPISHLGLHNSARKPSSMISLLSSMVASSFSSISIISGRPKFAGQHALTALTRHVQPHQNDRVETRCISSSSANILPAAYPCYPGSPISTYHALNFSLTNFIPRAPSADGRVTFTAPISLPMSAIVAAPIWPAKSSLSS